MQRRRRWQNGPASKLAPSNIAVADAMGYSIFEHREDGGTEAAASVDSPCTCERQPRSA